MNINQLLEQLSQGHHLNKTQMTEVIQACMTGDLNDVQTAAFLVLMRMKGETVEELTTAATVMAKYAHSIDLGSDLVDIVGTGGDGKNTFNISTVSSFVVAAAGLKIAKHGSHSVSSRSGSADLLLQAGFKLELSDQELANCIEKCQVAFLFGPHFHSAMRHVRSARQQLGIRTLFNLLGPLLNPAGVKRQVIGVFNKQWLKPIAQVLAHLGSERALVLSSDDGLDEISIAACTQVIEYQHGKFKSWVIDPKHYDCYHPTIDKIIVKNPAESLIMAESVFSGARGPARDIVVLNTAAALYCGGLCSDFNSATEKARLTIDSGLAKQRFNQLRELTQTCKR